MMTAICFGIAMIYTIISFLTDETTPFIISQIWLVGGMLSIGNKV